MANKANVAPPQTYELPLTEGLIYQPWGKSTNPSFYWKNGFNEVSIQFSLMYRDGSTFAKNAGKDIAFACLPVGYRPRHTCPFTGLVRQISTDRRCATVSFSVQEDGLCYIFIPNDLEFGIVFIGEANFIAGY